ncbi:hemagglutinin repeat-containing protein [Haemophilus haemoglobinophilus]|nr:hemagglutinin repeat-containing protein [Canicola haemoglobinophilus]
MKLRKRLKNLLLVFILLNINTQVLAKNRINISAERGVGLAHSRQRQTGANQESIGNQLNAKEINVEARHGNLMAMQTDFTARDEKGERIAGSHINLSAKENIELYAGKSHYRQQGKNQSYGTEVGTAFSVGAKTGWSFYAKEGFSKGKQESEGKTYHNSHIDTDTLTLSSGKDTALIGATAKAKTIYADIKGNLHIESQQDEHKQNSKQFGLGTKVEFGFGSSWEFSGNASAEKTKDIMSE